MENNPPTTKFNIGSSRGDGGGGDYRVSRRGYVRAPRPTTQLCSRFKEIPLSTQRAQPARRALEPRGRRAADRITAPSPRHTPYRRAWTLRGSRAESIRFAAPHIHRRLVTDLPRTRSKSCRAARALACFTRRRRHPERSSTGGVEQLVVSRHCAHRAPGLPLYPQTRYASVHRVAPRRPAGLAGSEVSV